MKNDRGMIWEQSLPVGPRCALAGEESGTRKTIFVDHGAAIFFSMTEKLHGKIFQAILSPAKKKLRKGGKIPASANSKNVCPVVM